MLLQLFATDFMRLRPAAIGAAADIDEADLLCVGGLSRRNDASKSRYGSSKCDDQFFILPLFGLETGSFSHRSGTKDLPSDAGVLIKVVRRLCEMMTSTTIVAI